MRWVAAPSQLFHATALLYTPGPPPAPPSPGVTLSFLGSDDPALSTQQHLTATSEEPVGIIDWAMMNTPEATLEVRRSPVLQPVLVPESSLSQLPSINPPPPPSKYIYTQIYIYTHTYMYVRRTLSHPLATLQTGPRRSDMRPDLKEAHTNPPTDMASITDEQLGYIDIRLLIDLMHKAGYTEVQIQDTKTRRRKIKKRISAEGSASKRRAELDLVTNANKRLAQLVHQNSQLHASNHLQRADIAASPMSPTSQVSQPLPSSPTLDDGNVKIGSNGVGQAQAESLAHPQLPPGKAPVPPGATTHPAIASEAPPSPTQHGGPEDAHTIAEHLAARSPMVREPPDPLPLSLSLSFSLCLSLCLTLLAPATAVQWRQIASCPSRPPRPSRPCGNWDFHCSHPQIAHLAPLATLSAPPTPLGPPAPAQPSPPLPPRSSVP